MKRNLLLIVLLLNIINTDIAAHEMKSEVNECFELTSIVFRLADSPEYVNNKVQTYTNHIDTYFARYKDHRLILFIKEIKGKYGISYDAVAVAAAFLEVRNDKVIIKNGLSSSKISEADSRWSEQTFKTFVTLLNDFYVKTKFRHFYSLHADLYNIATERMDQLLTEINYDWFKTFFGDKQKESLVVVSLCNGSNNYAFSMLNNGTGIVMGCTVDDVGLPTFSKNLILIIIHELLHSYTGSQISNYWDQIAPASQKIYSYVKDDMYKLAYGNARTMMSEWLTNLFSILYIKENPIKNVSVDYLIRNFQNQGFIWMERSTLFMKHFQDNRSQFVIIDDYIPQIMTFTNCTADNFNQVLNEYNNRQPYVVDVFPCIGSIFSSEISTIEIRFSEPMSDAHGLKPIEDKNVLAPPIMKLPSWKDEYTYVIELNKTQLEKGKLYGVKLNRNFFQSKKKYSMTEDYIYTFNTSK